MDKIAKFNVGERVIHLHQGYRAVIIDIDPIFQASGKVNPQANKRDFATRNPWYRLLVDGSNQMTYVEESLLKPDPNNEAIDNPQIREYLREDKGHYQSNSSQH